MAEAGKSYYNNVGGALFMSEKNKEKTRDLIKENLKKNNDVDQAEVKKLSTDEVNTYNNLSDEVDENGVVVKTKKEKQKLSAQNLEKELSEARRTDPKGLNKQTLILQETADQIRKKRFEEASTDFGEIKGSKVESDGSITTEKERKENHIYELETQWQKLKTEGTPSEIINNSDSANQLLQVIGTLKTKKAKEDRGPSKNYFYKSLNIRSTSS